MSTFTIEHETGTATDLASREHPHNGYFAGRFAAPSQPSDLASWFSWGRAESAKLARSGAVTTGSRRSAPAIDTLRSAVG